MCAALRVNADKRACLQLEKDIAVTNEEVLKKKLLVKKIQSRNETSNFIANFIFIFFLFLLCSAVGWPFYQLLIFIISLNLILSLRFLPI